MDAKRREFIRRTLAATFLVAIGAVAIDALITGPLQGGTTPPTGILVPPSASTEATTTQSPSQSTELSTSSQTTSQKGTTSTSTATSTSSQGVPAGYYLVAPVSALSGKSSAYFRTQGGGNGLLLLLGSSWKAFSATCTHQPCTVGFNGSQIQCPCHGGTFNPSNGAVTGGPPPTKLPEYGVLIQDGNLYVSAAQVN